MSTSNNVDITDHVTSWAPVLGEPEAMDGFEFVGSWGMSVTVNIDDHSSLRRLAYALGVPHLLPEWRAGGRLLALHRRRRHRA